MIRVGIVGATGYTGLELLRLLSAHPEVQIVTVTSRSERGNCVEDVFPGLRGVLPGLRFVDPGETGFEHCDLVYFAAPNGTAMNAVPSLLERGVRIIDLAADFRLSDAAVWQEWYGMEHTCPDLLEEAVYGLPEINREPLRTAALVANPGCYPTAAILGALPLLEAGLIDPGDIIADCKSGITGAGRKPAVGLLMAESYDNFRAYAASGHRHLPEIRQVLATVSGGPVGLTFVPHVLPIIRGINATLYTRLNNDSDDGRLQDLYAERFAGEPFVDVMPFGSHPETRSVRGSNFCRIALHRPQNSRRLIVLSVIDNLVKGAAGQAVQNMNLMFGLTESAGLESSAIAP